MKVYKTYVNMMNDRIKAQVQTSNPFAFAHVRGLSSMDQFEDSTCVVMASPGMLQVRFPLLHVPHVDFAFQLRRLD